LSAGYGLVWAARDARVAGGPGRKRENQHKLNDVTESVDQRSNGAAHLALSRKKNPKQTP